MSAPELEGLALYEYYSCPFCARVRYFLADRGASVELRDILAEPKYRRELVEATGRSTVPCLRIEEEDGGVRWLHESSDIIAYLRGRLSGPSD